MSTIPAYEQVKNKIVQQLAIAEKFAAEYIIKDDYLNEKEARLAILKLAFACVDYMYLAKDDKNKKLFAYFMANPEEFKEITCITAVLATCKEIIYNLGITQIEVAKLPPWEAFREIE